MTGSEPQANKNRIDALAIVAIAASSLFITVGGYVVGQHGNRLDAKDVRVTALEVSIARGLEHIAEHDVTAQHWISAILELQRLDRQTQIRLSRMETTNPRPDPFTGTQGKRLEEMINELRRQLNSPKHKTNEEQ